jgi:hypothetical protein
MNTEEAKFILSAYRPNGADTADAAFGDALRMAGDDPHLGAWFSQSRAHDAAAAAKLRQIAPPAGLREAILAGARVSNARARGGFGWGWAAGLAAAAVLAFGVFSMRAPVRDQANPSAFGGFAINDMVYGRHGSHGEASSALIAQLQTKGAGMPAPESIDFDKLKSTGCRTLSFAGHDVMEVCFARDGTEFHFYMARREGSEEAEGPSFVSEAAGSAAVWSDSRFTYALATTAGVEALHRLL